MLTAQAASTASRAAPPPLPSSSNRVSPTLSGLPLELKHKIVREVNWDREDEDGCEDPFDVFRGFSYCSDENTGWRTTTRLSGLSRVSKEWNLLCAPVIWKDITIWSDHSRALAFLARQFLPRHAHHVRTFRWLSEESEELPSTAQNLTGVIEFLPNLELLSLFFGRGQAVPHLRTDVPVTALRLYVRAGWQVDPAFFTPFSSTLTHLILDRYEVSKDAAFGLPKLTRLVVNNHDEQDWNSSVKARLEPFNNSPLDFLYVQDLDCRALSGVLRAVKHHSSTLRILRSGMDHAVSDIGFDRDRDQALVDEIKVVCAEHGIKAKLPRLLTMNEAVDKAEREEDVMISGIMDDLVQDDPHFWQ
ncbi:hypothetical protein JCM8097_008133 [Rhodosporidiobolus ruineniae]